jgi:hypothetical protein
MAMQVAGTWQGTFPDSGLSISNARPESGRRERKGNFRMNRIGRCARALVSASLFIGLLPAMAQVSQVTDGTTTSTACTSFVLGSGTLTLSPNNCIKSASVVTHPVTVAKTGAGTGTVTSAPGGISCGATCTASFNAGTSVSLSAAADAGSVFIGWSGACTGTGACSVTADAAKSVGALFVAAAASPTLYPNPASLDFGGQSMATTSPAQTFTLTNIGASTVSVASVTPDSAQFAQSNNCATLAAGQACTVTVTFSPPVAAGPLLSTVPASGNLAVASNAAALSVPVSGTAEKSLVSHYYRSVLRRAPDSSGKAFWESEATRVVGLGAGVNEVWYTMATAFFFSGEYASFGRDDTAFVTDLYITFFNRAPDAGGLAFWTGQLSQGMPRQVVSLSFMFSPEFANFSQGIFGTSVTRKEVDTVVDFYRGLLARMPDNGGFASWVSQFRAAQCQGVAAVSSAANSISSAFINSPEYGGRARNNPQFVGDLYNAILRRGGDLAGVQFWIDQLNAGASRDSVRAQFLASAEFTARINDIVAQGCLP